jgi:hypothetical protein
MWRHLHAGLQSVAVLLMATGVCLGAPALLWAAAQLQHGGVWVWPIGVEWHTHAS